MDKLIKIDEYPVRNVLKILLQDKTTKKNIVFATNSYADMGEDYQAACPITEALLLGMDAWEIQPRVLKDAAEQSERTKKNAEVMTPAWVVNRMNNHCDTVWFDYTDVFNKEDGERWITKEEEIFFPEGKTWEKYIDSTRIEITCGEAPYLVSRYDTTTGEMIPVKERIGILDRKLRVVGENTDNKEDWLKWAIRAYQSTYGYEYQGDNLLLGRCNLLLTFVDYMEERWSEKPDDKVLKQIANIIAWNLWQMDGLSGTVPHAVQEVPMEQLAWNFTGEEKDPEYEAVPCRIFDWRSKESVEYCSLKEN